MSLSTSQIILGSRSPRRRELLSLLIGPERVLVRPPTNPAEPALDDARDLEELSSRLRALARWKNDDVAANLRLSDTLEIDPILTADTIIVGHDGRGELAILGQPPDADDWQQTVRNWFESCYFDRPHHAVTAICLRLPDGSCQEEVVTTEVTFRADAREWLTWYLATGESLGKAGGYGIQGAASLFVERIEGSLSNVIGLPLLETANLLRGAGIISEPSITPAS